MASSALINTFAAEFSKFGNFMFDHVRKVMAADPDSEMPDVDEMVRLYLQPEAPIKLKKPRAKKTASSGVVGEVEVTQVPAASKTTGTGTGKASKGAKNKELCTATTGKGTQCTRCAAQGQVFCNVHLKAAEPKTGDKKTKAAPKKKKPEDMPKHTHPIGEVAETGSCDLCESHGNPLTEEEAESAFEVKADTLPFEEDEDNSMILGEEEFDED